MPPMIACTSILFFLSLSFFLFLSLFLFLLLFLLVLLLLLLSHLALNGRKSVAEAAIDLTCVARSNSSRDTNKQRKIAQVRGRGKRDGKEIDDEEIDSFFFRKRKREKENIASCLCEDRSASRVACLALRSFSLFYFEVEPPSCVSSNFK